MSRKGLWAAHFVITAIAAFKTAMSRKKNIIRWGIVKGTFCASNEILQSVDDFGFIHLVLPPILF